MKTKDLVIAALIAGAYSALSLMLAPLAFGPVQFRVSEALTLLPMLFPQAVPGLFVGCIISNAVGGYGIIDVVFGSLATLLAAYLTRYIANHVRREGLKLALGAIPPVVINAVVVGAVLSYAATNSFGSELFFLYAAQIFITQVGVIYVIGIPMTIAIGRLIRKKAI